MLGAERLEPGCLLQNRENRLPDTDLGNEKGPHADEKQLDAAFPPLPYKHQRGYRDPDTYGDVKAYRDNACHFSYLLCRFPCFMREADSI